MRVDSDKNPIGSRCSADHMNDRYVLSLIQIAENGVKDNSITNDERRKFGAKTSAEFDMLRTRYDGIAAVLHRFISLRKENAGYIRDLAKLSKENAELKTKLKKLRKGIGKEKS